jgi:uncharacterized protein (DUF2141 family)
MSHQFLNLGFTETGSAGAPYLYRYMKRLRILVFPASFFLAISAPMRPQAAPPAQDCTLRIHVDGLRNSTGVVGTAIFTAASGWPEDMSKSFRHGPTPIASGERQATAEWKLPSGTYGIVAIHDENKNHKLDRNFIGIPKEGFGFANNPHVGLSAPGFNQALVRVTCPVTETSIHLIYK